jgi:hypothetical protein
MQVPFILGQEGNGTCIICSLLGNYRLQETVNSATHPAGGSTGCPPPSRSAKPRPHLLVKVLLPAEVRLYILRSNQRIASASGPKDCLEGLRNGAPRRPIVFEVDFRIIPWGNSPQCVLSELDMQF